jgi:hypothetical protein
MVSIPEALGIFLFSFALTPVTNYFLRRGRKSTILYCLFWVAVFAMLVGIWLWMRWSILRDIHH